MMIKNLRLLYFTLAAVIIFTFPSASGNVFASAALSEQSLLFEEPSTEFNVDLAKFSLLLSSAAYGDTNENIEKILTGYSFVNDSVYDNASYEKASKSGTNLAAYSFAQKKIRCENKEYTLIAVVIRGTNGDNEWISNFNVNDSGNYPGVHEGFSKAKQALLTDLTSYVNNLDLDKTKTKLLITGHSRGAAVANLLAADLSKTHKLALQSNIYCYTFATPNVAKIGTSNYLNIFNGVNPADIITEIPLTTWGYGKYGVNYSLPEASQLSQEELDEEQKLLTQLTAMAPTVNDFYNAKLSILLFQKKLIPDGTANAHTPERYEKWLNQADPKKLSEQVFELQLKLIPDTNYA